MATRNWVLAMALLVAALPDDGRAEPNGMHAPDCGRLADLVYAEVTLHYLGLATGAAGREPVEPSPQIVMCDQTAITVSAAFSEALAAVGGSADWGWPPAGGGDVCLSGFIDQCYPDRGARVPGVGGDAIRATWLAVRQTVRLAMPWGSAADRTVFSPEAMRQALRSAMRQIRR